MKQKRHAATILALAFGSPLMYGQFSFETFNPISAETNGVHLHTASISSSYASNAYGTGLVGLVEDGSNSQLSMLQGSAVFGWARRGEQSDASVMYAPSFIRSFHTSSYSSMNHSLAASFNRQLSTKWSLSSSAT